LTDRLLNELDGEGSDEKNASFDSNEKEILDLISWDTDSADEDILVDNSNFKLFSRF